MNELRQTKIEMLEYAARNLNRNGGFVCTSIIMSAKSKTIKRSFDLKEKAKNDLLKYISKALRGYAFYSDWVSYKIDDDVYCNVSYEKRAKMFQQGRINWIKWMIQCLKEDQAREDACESKKTK